jgi:hypothetical protein
MNDLVETRSCCCSVKEQKQIEEKPISKTRKTLRAIPSMLLSAFIAVFSCRSFIYDLQKIGI